MPYPQSSSKSIAVAVWCLVIFFNIRPSYQETKIRNRRECYARNSIICEKSKLLTDSSKTVFELITVMTDKRKYDYQQVQNIGKDNHLYSV